MNDIILKNEDEIKNKIYEVRGKQVMLDSDLAKLYECVNGTKDINKAVKRNIERFPEDFYFQLTKEEYENLKSQIVTAKSDISSRFQSETLNYNDSLRFQIGTLNSSGNLRGQHMKYLPYVFTEQGVAMLSSVLRTKVAAEVSIRIMRAFVEMKQYISSNLIEQKYINEIVLKDSKRIDLIESVLSEFKEKNNHLFYEGQIYDAYSLLIDILKEAKKEIIIIDNYIDKNILDVLSKIDKNVLLITNKYNNNDYDKYKMQYKNISIRINNIFHDRFIILDKKILYHSGASFKDLGTKCFEISKINDLDVLNKLLAKVV